MTRPISKDTVSASFLSIMCIFKYNYQVACDLDCSACLLVSLESSASGAENRQEIYDEKMGVIRDMIKM